MKTVVDVFPLFFQECWSALFYKAKKGRIYTHTDSHTHIHTLIFFSIDIGFILKGISSEVVCRCLHLDIITDYLCMGVSLAGTGERQLSS